MCTLPTPCGPPAALPSHVMPAIVPQRCRHSPCVHVPPMNSLHRCSHREQEQEQQQQQQQPPMPPPQAHIPPLSAQQQQQHCAADAGGPSALDALDELPLPRRTPPGSRSTCGGRPASRELLQRLWCDDEGADEMMAAQEQRPRQQGQAGHGAAGGAGGGGRVGAGEVSACREAASCLSDQAAVDIEPLYTAAAMDRAGATATPTVIPPGTALLDVRRSISMETAVFMR